MKSWKTTTAGLGTIFATLGTALNQLFDGNPATNPDWNYVLPLIFTGLIGLFARDNNVPSEAVKSAQAEAARIKGDTVTLQRFAAAARAERSDETLIIPPPKP